MGWSRIKPESMFHRRLLLLSGLVGLGMVAPIAQMARWTLGRGPELRVEAESHLSTWHWLPTTRGKILDRKGRVLAQDRPSFDIAVDYKVITGEWAYKQAYRRAKRIHREQWSSLTSKQRRDLAETFEPDFQARLDSMWDQMADLGGVSREEIENRKNAIKSEVQALKARVSRDQRIRLEEKAAEIGVEESIKPSELNRPVAEELIAHTILRRVSDRVAFDFIQLTQEVDVEGDEALTSMPGVQVIDTGAREYPMESIDLAIDRSNFPGNLRSDQPARVRVDGVATHILGWMRHKVYREDNIDDDGLPRSPTLADGTPDRSYYLEGESIGQAGIERGAERELRGLRGIQTTKLDTQEHVQTPAVPGKDIQLTIDIELQARIQALFMPQMGLTIVQPWHASKQPQPGEEPHVGVPRLGEFLAGSAVVLDVGTGQILAMVSSPGFTHQAIREDPDSIFKDVLFHPAVNRAIAQPYAPGSIVKPLVLNAAVTSGRYHVDERVPCTGHFYPNQPNMLRCWTEKMFHTTHSIKLGHDLDGRDAIMGSCNIFFYEMGRRLGPAGIVDWFGRFGVGNRNDRWGLGIGDEYPGTVPSGKSMTTDAAILMGIGQGPIAWTPLHAADAYATMARAGIRITPRLRLDQSPRTTDLKLDGRGVEQALQGLLAVVQDPKNGTAHHITVEDPSTGVTKQELVFNVMEEPNIAVWGKSGTADASPIVADMNQDHRKEVLRDGDHAWTVCLAGDEGQDGRPKYAVAVVIDYGGSGGRVAGPVANQVVRALIAEGYLKAGEKKKDKEKPKSAEDAE